MLISYKTLFSIELLHEYFNKDVFSDCTILPTNDTRQYFTGDNLLQRFFTNRFYVLIKDNNGKPFSPIAPDRVYRFYIHCDNANFFNYTNLDQRIGKGNFLYFSNLVNNKVGTDLNLTAPIAPYNSATTYQIEDFIKDPNPARNDIYEAVQQGSGHALNDLSFWLPRATQHFVSSADVTRQSSNIFRYSFSSPIK